MGLTAAEKKALENLQRKAEEPDAPPVGRSINATINLGDPAQVALAIKHGFLTADEVDELKDDKSSEGDEEDGESPKRKGYFGS